MHFKNPTQTPKNGSTCFSSNTVDRIIIQIYMLVVLCSVVFLLLVNNPPESFRSGREEAPERSANPASATVVNSH